jgi:hypothetical protein
MDFRINGHAMTTGSISTGTLKFEDLIPAFTAEIKRLVSRSPDIVREAEAWIYAMKNNDPHTYLRDYDVSLGEGVGPKEAVEAMGPSVMHDLDYYLNQMAPDGIRFGAHEGDGADIGWWESEEPEGL